MDEMMILRLIAEGESKRLDFKRELKLEMALDKAEFVKDIISLANSSPDVGYLLIGVDDNKYIHGINHIPEEQIQQLIHTYVTPALSLGCYSVPVTAPTFPLVGVIEIDAIRKPYKVARAIDKLNQDDVFVRRGSVIAKASPEEIIDMYKDSKEKYIQEKTTRLKRVKSYGTLEEYSWEKKEKDLEWLKNNTDGYELGEVLYWEAEILERESNDSLGEIAFHLIDKAITLGYKTSDVYYLRAIANQSLYNYGLALQDIDEAILISWPDNAKGKYFALKAQILIHMERFQEAHQALSKGQGIDKGELGYWLWKNIYGLDNALLCRYALACEFGEYHIPEPMKTAMQILILRKGRYIRGFKKHPKGNITIETELSNLSKMVPGILHTLENILGEELWNAMMGDDEFTLRVDLPTRKSQLPKDW